MTRRSVDLPQPLGPIRATIPPPSIDRSMPSERLVGLARAGPEGERHVAEIDRAAHRTSTAGSTEASGRRIGAVAG